MRNPHAGEPFTTSDEEIAAALEDVSIPTLMLSLVHMSGDPELSRPRCKPAGSVPQRGPGLHDRGGQGRGRGPSRSRSSATTATAAALSRRRSRPSCCSEMMAWLVCEEVPDEYVPMLHRGDGARRHATPGGSASRPTPRRAHAFPVVVIGCGQSGLLAGIRLQGGRHPVHHRREERRRRRHLVGELLPRAHGSTSATTSTATASSRATHWTEFFAQQPELQAYFEAVMHKHGIEPHVRWETEVIGAHWDERRRRPGRCGSATPTEPRRP